MDLKVKFVKETSLPVLSKSLQGICTGSILFYETEFKSFNQIVIMESIFNFLPKLLNRLNAGITIQNQARLNNRSDFVNIYDITEIKSKVLEAFDCKKIVSCPSLVVSKSLLEGVYNLLLHRYRLGGAVVRHLNNMAKQKLNYKLTHTILRERLFLNNNFNLFYITDFKNKDGEVVITLCPEGIPTLGSKEIDLCIPLSVFEVPKKLFEESGKLPSAVVLFKVTSSTKNFKLGIGFAYENEMLNGRYNVFIANSNQLPNLDWLLPFLTK